MKQTSTVLLVVAVAAVFFGAGYYVGSTGMWGKSPSATENQYRSIVNAVYPQPAQYIGNMSGTVKGVFGALLSVEVNDPEDYLPHTDGTPAKKMNVGVNITKDTSIVVVSMSAGGTQKQGAMSDIKVGNTVNFWSSQNIRGAKQVDATIVQVIR